MLHALRVDGPHVRLSTKKLRYALEAQAPSALAAARSISSGSARRRRARRPPLLQVLQGHVNASWRPPLCLRPPGLSSGSDAERRGEKRTLPSPACPVWRSCPLRSPRGRSHAPPNAVCCADGRAPRARRSLVAPAKPRRSIRAPRSVGCTGDNWPDDALRPLTSEGACRACGLVRGLRRFDVRSTSADRPSSRVAHRGAPRGRSFALALIVTLPRGGGTTRADRDALAPHRRGCPCARFHETDLVRLAMAHRGQYVTGLRRRRVPDRFMPGRRPVRDTRRLARPGCYGTE